MRVKVIRVLNIRNPWSLPLSEKYPTVPYRLHPKSLEGFKGPTNPCSRRCQVNGDTDCRRWRRYCKSYDT